MTRIPVFLASDENYAPQTAVTMLSCMQHTSANVDFYILDSGITEESKKKIRETVSEFKNCTVKFVAIDTNYFQIGGKSADYVSLATYSRLLIPELKPDLKKVIYSDVDVLFVGDIAELYNEDLQQKILGAVPNIYYVKYPTRNNVRKRLSLPTDHLYFYAGLLLIDCEKWRSENVTNRLLTLTRKLKGKLVLGDQDILNAFFKGNNYAVLDTKYEVTNRYLKYRDTLPEHYQRSIDNPVIRHYEGRLKPWNSAYVSGGTKTRDFQAYWDCVRRTPFSMAMLANYESIIQDSDISFVVHGTIRSDVTVNSLEKLREIFPLAEIIVSTTDGQDLPDDLYDVRVVNDDPLATRSSNGDDGAMNGRHRDLNATLAGLKAATRRYTFQMRSDFTLIDAGFLYFFNSFQGYEENFKVFERKVLACSRFTRDPRSRRNPSQFHPSDIAFFGLTTDILDLFDVPTISNRDERGLDSEHLFHHSSSLGQYLWINLLLKKGKTLPLDQLKRCESRIAEETERYFVSNFIFLSWEVFGLRPPEEFNDYIANDYAGHLTHIKYMRLYKTYIDPNQGIPGKDKERSLSERYKRKAHLYRFIGSVYALFRFGLSGKNLRRTKRDEIATRLMQRRRKRK